ncbi:ADP-ribosylglycohydrolase family protein [Tengunoibacter tsumagoiensis]|uniref:ADP-ribosylglycohydrolase n=1 Tax=Tengunoibacter tsumagoiensis TaxID=2014871 RepID=A0A402A4M9_9CHLR|nr:ADP-ribosylglycohydrolase family protein [Tengunoibacter tsumagoiensis]GCE14016.1 hypothetical protein KTT_38750 [Tengunoibacter tsumagoiensis]
MIDLNSQAFRDKVYGCWLGKNCGGTLGAPLERGYGEPEPFDVWWYPELKEGGIPNDDLEMQLIWLKALEEVGPRLKASDLVQYWLDHIGYNWDEYGLNKTNLRLGLLPPVSGGYNNWFKDSMGCPIRSEIWACIAPGQPRIAAKYAYEDAIVDHAGGESIYGELFNVAIESAAFVISDPEQLLDIGLSYVPPTSQTAKAILAARQAHREGLTWQAARKRVLEATPHFNAQYSPINMGFQVIGWLYGEDFGDAICKAVNCGYDTDCTGATLGSYLGIIEGQGRLPQKWTEPLGQDISTNESWGGLFHASDGVNPVPANLVDLTDRVIVQAKRVLTAHGILNGESILEIDPATLYADESIQALWTAKSTQIDYEYPGLTVSVDYVNTPAVEPEEEKALRIVLTNVHPEPLQLHYRLFTPSGWELSRQTEAAIIQAHSTVAVDLLVKVPEARLVENTNRLYLDVVLEGRPAVPATPIVLIGASRYFVSECIPADGRSDQELFDEVFAPEQITSDAALLLEQGRPGTWSDLYTLENELTLKEHFSQSGVLYVRTFFWNPDAEQQVWLGAPANCPTKFWVNNQLALSSFRYPLVRPNYNGNQETYTKVDLRAGWNEIFFKFVRNAEARQFEGYIILCQADHLYAGLYRVGRTQVPWEQNNKR